MGIGDWINAAFLVVIGVLLGLAANGLAGLVLDGAWLFALMLLVICGGAVLLFFLFDGLLDRLFARVFPGGVRPAAVSYPAARKPLALLASLPGGLVLGVFLAQSGLAPTILGLF